MSIIGPFSDPGRPDTFQHEIVHYPGEICNCFFSAKCRMLIHLSHENALAESMTGLTESLQLGATNGGGL